MYIYVQQKLTPYDENNYITIHYIKAAALSSLSLRPLIMVFFLILGL